MHHTYKEGGSLLPRAWATFVEEVTYSQAWMHGWDSGWKEVGWGHSGQKGAARCFGVPCGLAIEAQEYGAMRETPRQRRPSCLVPVVTWGTSKSGRLSVVWPRVRIRMVLNETVTPRVCDIQPGRVLLETLEGKTCPQTSTPSSLERFY